MATFSPSPAPRRSSRFQQRAGSPSRRSQRQPASRLASPPLLGRSLFPQSSIQNVMDVDDATSIQSDSPSFPEVTTYAKTDELAVTFYANLPIEVKQVLRNAGEPCLVSL